MAVLFELQNVTLHFPPAPPLLRGITLAVTGGERVALLGASGSGKTSILRLIAGLVRPTRGLLRWRGLPYPLGPQPGYGIGLMHQQPVLFPHLSVQENLALGWQLRYNAKVSRRWWGKSESSPLRPRLEQVAELLELGPLLSRSPIALSGGEKQRVALGRILTSRPAVFLLDEPLAFLDAPLAGRILARLPSLFKEWQATVVWVTHQPDEARRLADRTLRVSEGRLEPVVLAAAEVKSD